MATNSRSITDISYEREPRYKFLKPQSWDITSSICCGPAAPINRRK